MAGMSAEGVLEKISRDHLECPICCCRFINPKILTCLHSFCHNCLEKLTEVQPDVHVISCPVCRRQLDVPEAGISGISNNFSLMALVDEITQQEELVKSQSSLEIICEECEETEPATFRCLECRVYLCDFCQTAHKRNKKTKGHEMATIDDLCSGTAIFKSQLWKRVPKCDKHGSQEFIFFCETCMVLICAACTALDHRAPEHKFLDVSAAIVLCKEEASKLTLKAEESLAQLKAEKEKASGAFTEHKEATMEQHNDISKRADEEVAKIRAAEYLLKGKLSLVCNEKDTAFDESLATHGIKVEKLETTIESVKTLMGQVNTFDLLKLKKSLMQNLKEATEIDIPTAVKGLTSEDFKKCKDISDKDLEESAEHKDLRKYVDLFLDKKVSTSQQSSQDPSTCTKCTCRQVVPIPQAQRYAPKIVPQLPTSLSWSEQAGRMRVGTRVIRGPDWNHGNQDCREGKITYIDDGKVDVRWADGCEYEDYRMDDDEETYELQMAKYALSFSSSHYN